MKTINTITIIALAVAALAPEAASALVYRCPDPTIVSKACQRLDRTPLSCFNLSNGRSRCDALQCNQAYIDNYVACQCRHGSTKFYEKSINIELLLRRCGQRVLINPYGEPSQYPPGQDIQLSSSDPATSSDQLDASVVSVATPVIGVKAGEEPMETLAPNGSHKKGGVSASVLVELTLGSMAFLLAATLLIMIIGSRRRRDSNHNDNGRETPAPEYSEAHNSVVCQFALSIHLTSVSVVDDSEFDVMWKVERDLSVNGTLPAYSDIMADGSSFAAIKNITQRNSTEMNRIGYNYDVRDAHTHGGRSNSPVTHNTTLAESDCNADGGSVDNSMGRYISSRDNTV